MEIKETSEGESIVPIMKGHLVIPVTERKYKIIATITIELTKNDIINLPLKKLLEYINDKKMDKEVFNRIILAVLTTEFPKILYDRIKKDFKNYFNRCDMFRIDKIEFFGKDSILVHLDCLEELKHIEVKE